MRTIFFLAALVFLGGSIALAQPTTAPSQPKNTTVLIIPFKQVGDTSAHGWVSAALQESLMAQVARFGDSQPKTLDKSMATSEFGNSLQAAQDAKVAVVVFGSYQVSDDQLRVTGQANDVSTGRVIGTLSATGRLQDLFQVEDVLAAQLRPLLPQAPNSGLAQVTYGPNQMSTPYAYEQQNTAQGIYPYTAAAPVPDQSPYVYPYAYPPEDDYYDYGYAYPSYVYPYTYDYGYPWGWGFGGVYIGGGFHRGFDHRGGFGHGPIVHPFGGGAHSFAGGGVHAFAGGGVGAGHSFGGGHGR